MIYNDNIPTEYGNFPDVTSGASPTMCKPKPNSLDYSRGYVTRFFAKKLNDDVIVEIDGNRQGNVNFSLYTVVSLAWQISGPTENVYTSGILDKTGVRPQNRFAIQTVNAEQGVDLSKVLSNLLEYWQGR